MGMPPGNPGPMSPQEKAGLGGSLGLNAQPSPTSGSGTVSGDLSSVNVGEVSSEMGDAHAESAAVQNEARDVILQSPAGSTATEGYHLDQQSEALRETESPLPVGDPDIQPPQEQRA